MDTYAAPPGRIPPVCARRQLVLFRPARGRSLPNRFRYYERGALPAGPGKRRRDPRVDVGGGGRVLGRRTGHIRTPPARYVSYTPHRRARQPVTLSVCLVSATDALPSRRRVIYLAYVAALQGAG